MQNIVDKIKTMTPNELEKLSSEIREDILNAVSTNGGHLSSNLGVVELVLALYRSFDFPKDKLIFDVSHQCYAHKIITGRDLTKLNSFDGPSGFIKCSESKYDCFEAGHSSTALSAGEAFAIARDLHRENNEVVVLIGDSSLANGVSFEALNNIASRKNKVIIVLNDNNMSISKPVGGLENVLRDISPIYAERNENKNNLNVNKTIFEELGFDYIGPINGHDFEELKEAFEKAKETKNSVIVHAFTQKGMGYKFAENDESGYWHNVDSFDIDTGLPKNQHEGKESFSKCVGELTCDVLEKNENATLICPAMVKGSFLEKAFEKYPDRCFDVGISEEHAAVLAGAMTYSGLHPILCVYSTFLQRAYDELFHDCSRINADMTILVDHAGFCGRNGETHMGLYDEAFLKTMPNVIVSMPSTLSEAKALLNLSMEKGHGVFAIRYPSSYEEINDANHGEKIEFGKWKFVKRSEDKNCAIIAVGPNGKTLFDKLIKDDIDVTMINPLFLNPLDEQALSELLSYKKIVCYDAYATINGFIESVKNYLFDKKYSGEFVSFGIKNCFVQHDTLENQEKTYKVHADQIFDYIAKNN